ncbi:tetratricopeptide repeat protein [bacterium]|nr:tetratricopeptide repeat protein [bacterium]
MSIIHDALKKAEKNHQSEGDKGVVSSLPTSLKKQSGFFENKRRLVVISSCSLIFLALIILFFSGGKKERSQDTFISQKIKRENQVQTNENVNTDKNKNNLSKSSPKVENIMEDLGKKIEQQKKKNIEPPIETREIPVEKAEGKSEWETKVEKSLTKETLSVAISDEIKSVNLKKSNKINQMQGLPITIEKQKKSISEVKQPKDIVKSKLEKNSSTEEHDKDIDKGKENEQKFRESDYEKKNAESKGAQIDQESLEETEALSSGEEPIILQHKEISKESAHVTPIEEEEKQVEEQNISKMSHQVEETAVEPEHNFENNEELKKDESQILPSETDIENEAVSSLESKTEKEDFGPGVIHYDIRDKPSESEESKMLIEKLPKKDESKGNSLSNDTKPKTGTAKKVDSSQVTRKSEESTSIPKSESLKFYYDKALSLEKEGNLKEAMNYYKKVITLDPRNSKAHNSLGNIYLKLRETEMAKKEFQLVLMLDPLDSAARNNLGLVYLELNEYIKAIGEFNKAVNASPTNIASYNNLGITYKKLKKYNDALEQFNKAIFIDKNFAQAYYGRATVLESLGRIQEAIMDYRKFIDFAPENLKEEVRKVQDHIMDLYESSSNY